MNTRIRLRSLHIVPCLALALASQDAPKLPQAPPRVPETIRTPDHGSRWEYPREFQVPEGCQVHFVATGDTLWDLGAKYLGNPFAWPQIWEQNKWVKDPHWIYPGDPILVPTQNRALARAAEVPETTAPPVVADLQPELRPTAPSRGVTSEYAFTFQDFLQLPYLVTGGYDAYLKEMKALKIVGSTNPDRIHFGDGERLLLDGGQDRGLKVGDRRLILKVVKRALYHPEDGRQRVPLGDVVQQVGIVRVIQVQARGAVAIIERSLDGVMAGDVVVPFREPAAIPLKLRTDTTEPLPLAPNLAQIIFTRDGRTLLGTGEMVIIDRGTRDGYKEGDVLLGFSERNWEVGGRREAAPAGEKTNRYLGQLLVVRAEAGSATCRILRTVDTLGIGTRLTR
jgi:hypothetical protein